VKPKVLAIGIVLGLLLASAVGLLGPMSAGSSAISASTDSSAPPAAPAATSAAVGPSTGVSNSSSETVGAAVTPHYATLNLPGPHPSAWGPSDQPPGNPFLLDGPSVSIAPCYAISPSAGGDQPVVPNNCVGHDEPSLSFYSDTPGSGGNVSWNATLPQDVGATQNQSDLYAAAWFGLVATDPAAYLDQCYVEVQLYPDFSWNHPSTTVLGAWSGAVVGWQIDPMSGAVDTCFYAQLHLNGVDSAPFFQMTQGDDFVLNLVGWSGDSAGEHVSIHDLTAGISTYVNLYNSSGGFPLDPAYAANDVPDALLWGSGGQLPISFAFEIGREGNPGGVDNSTYGGCTPGPGPSSSENPSVPCPSYDPVSWVNDTQTPWWLGVPVFGGSAGLPTQFDLSSSVGGTPGLVKLSNDTCGEREGSTDCTYPWFGYSCSNTAFTFGAANYALESNDFGQGGQFPSVPSISLLGLPTFSPTSYSVPGCGGPAYTITIGTTGVSGGSVYFLSGDYSGSSAVNGIPPGSYSIRALSPAGAGFEAWSLSGSVSVANPTNPSTALYVRGSGTVKATFTSTPSTDLVSFDSTTPSALTLVSHGEFYSGSTAASTIPAGGSMPLAPGVYGIQAGPPSGYNFTSWSVGTGSNGISIASNESMVTWLTVSGEDTSATINVVFTATSGITTVNVTTIGGGTVWLNGAGLSGSENVIEHAGTFTLAAIPTAGWEFDNWSFGVSSVAIDFNASTNVSFAPGEASITATFAASVTTFVNASADGRILLNEVGPLANRTTLWLAPGGYPLDALPFGHYVFYDWQVSSPSALWVMSPKFPVTTVEVNSTGTITAVFQSAPSVNLTLINNPATGGRIDFNGQMISGATTLNTTLTNGTYLLRYFPTPGDLWVGWSHTGPLSMPDADYLVVKGGGGTITANFKTAAYAVSYVTEGSGGSLSLKVNGQTVQSGGTVYLPLGKYPLLPLAGPNTTFLKWVASGHMYVGNQLKPTTNLTVNGAGTLTAITDPFSLTGVTAIPSGTDVGYRVSFVAGFQGTAPTSFSWTGLPTGCTSANLNPLPCVPSASGTFSVVVTVKGANGLAVKSIPLSFTVNGLPSISSFTPSHSELDVGMTLNLTTTASGGSAPLTYSYSPLPSGCVSSNTPTLSCIPSAVGVTKVVATVTDAAGATATATQTITVNPDLVSHLTANRAVVTATAPFVLNVSTSGGTPTVTFAYTGLPSPCTSADVVTLSCTPLVAGNYTIEVTATDAAGGSMSATVDITVNPATAISNFEATPDTLTLDSNVTFTVSASGGTGPLNYTYSGLPGGCSSVNLSKFTCTPIFVGTYTVKVTVTDTELVSATTTTIVTVNSGTSPSGTTTGSPSVPWWVWLVIALVIAAVVIGLVVWLRGRSPPPDAASSSPPPSEVAEWSETPPSGGSPPP